ncbi:MAG: 2-polyprenyl-3-methyl-5-hydroxy-6-metoxy-1,4-benzoquinol methylase [Planctomycetota bacterium]|jgi:2-polyprenyl-3-methyl-5-hydroxy-6-metoxy-1,4-benzoquinol methylase
MLVHTHHVPLRETMLWLEPHLQHRAARILEVGCGQGHLAAALASAGHQVVAIDSNEEAVAATRYKGVDARVGTFPEQLPESDQGRFDVVLFTRSLHHLEDLDAACAAAFSILSPTGVVLIEDWAWNLIDERTAAWAYGLMGIGRTTGLVPAGTWQGGTDPLQHWIDEHQHHVHEVAAMRDAISKHSAAHNVTITEQTAPYFYRYFCDYLAKKADGATIVESVLAAERQMLEAGAMEPLGWRLAATRA